MGDDICYYDTVNWPAGEMHMTLTGYYFNATGTYAFYDGERGVCRVVDAPLQPIRIYRDEAVWTVSRDSLCVTDAHTGEEVARILRLSGRRFVIAMDGAAVTGRVIHRLLRNTIVYTDLDDEEVGRVEYRVDRSRSRGLSPQRYVATVRGDDALIAAMLAAPFLDIKGIRVG